MRHNRSHTKRQPKQQQISINWIPEAVIDLLLGTHMNIAVSYDLAQYAKTHTLAHTQTNAQTYAQIDYIL